MVWRGEIHIHQDFWEYFEPHVLPLIVPDKLLAQEISYQLTVEGISRSLNNSKKRMWPQFPFNCGQFTLNDFKHAEKEVSKIKGCKFATIPGRQYDPRQIAFNVTASVSIARFEHEPDPFDDLFVSLDNFPQIYDLAKSKFQKEEMNKFLLFRSQRLLRVPLDQLRISIQGSETEGTYSKTPVETSAGKVITQLAVNQPTVHTTKVGTVGKPEAQKGNTDGRSD